MTKTLLVSEIYGPVIQGEGPVAGVPTVFVRLGGCDYHCGTDRRTGGEIGSFVCDSLYAVLPKFKNEWIKMTVPEIMSTVMHLTGKDPILITLSGGNPALQDCKSLIEEGKKLGYSFAIETQGTKSSDWWFLLDWVVVSPKPPSSKMKTDWEKLDECMKRGSFVKNFAVKIVVFDEEDYKYAQEVWERYHPKLFFLQAGTNSPYRDTSSFETMAMFRNDILIKLDWLSQKVIDDHWYDVRVLPQIHSLIHGSRRGV